MANDKKDKILYLEFLRVIAMLSVVLLHVTSKAVSLVEGHTVAWYIYNFFRCFCKWGVDIFIMISGALFLNPERNITIKKMYNKYISKIFIMLVIWSFIYAIYPLIRDVLLGEKILWGERFPNVFRNFILGNYHLWYLYMLIGLYMLTPFLKVIVKYKEIMQYFLVLAVIFSVILPMLSNIDCLELLVAFLEQMHLNMVAGYVFIYVLGYYIFSNDFSIKQVRVCKIICVVVFVATVILTSRDDGGLFLTDGVFSVGVILMSTCLFIMAKYLRKWKLFTPIIIGMSKYSLGIYLIHAFFVHAITVNCIDLFKPGIDIVVSFVTILIISYIGVFVIKKMPYIGKVIV